MLALTPKFIVDDTGKRVGALLDMDEYERILVALEELEEIRAYEAAKAVKETPISFEEAIADIEG